MKTCALRLSVKHSVLHRCEAQGASRAGPVTDSGGNHVKHAVLHWKLEAASFEADASFAVKHAVLHQKLDDASTGWTEDHRDFQPTLISGIG